MPMSEHFYVVARELQAKADHLKAMAADLFYYADQIAEQEIKAGTAADDGRGA